MLQYSWLGLYEIVLSNFLHKHYNIRYCFMLFSDMTQWNWFSPRKFCGFWRCLLKISSTSNTDWTWTLIFFLVMCIKHTHRFILIFCFCYIEVFKCNITEYWLYGDVIPISMLEPMITHLLAFILYLDVWLQ